MKKTFNQMRRHGIDEIVMLTGDSEEVANTVAHKMELIVIMQKFYQKIRLKL